MQFIVFVFSLLVFAHNHSNPIGLICTVQGFMQDKIIASHTCFGGHMDVNCSASLQTFKCVWWPQMDYKHTCDTIYTHFQGITNNIYGFGKPFFAPSFFTRPPIFLPVHIRFYPSKWQVDRSLHKAMVLSEMCKYSKMYILLTTCLITLICVSTC